jgi:hypothetical protein
MKVLLAFEDYLIIFDLLRLSNSILRALLIWGPIAEKR